jgi:hypothetical protein
VTKKFESEAVIQELLESAVSDDKICECIKDTARIDELSKRDTDNQFPQFAVDHISRLKAIEAGASVLKSLSMLVLLTGDENISVTSGEILRPDLVCINPERQSVVLFEVKKSSQTGREALTELLAYEQELKNLMPLLSGYDFNFVLISPEWSTLMDHAVSGAIAWSNKKVLCLKPLLNEKEELELETYLPTAWKITGAAHLPEDALPSVTICLYQKDAYTKPNQKNISKNEGKDEVDSLDVRLLTAMEVMAREGDRLGTHGFALLWRDNWDQSLTCYNITICGIAPMELYKSSRQRGNISDKDGRLVSKLDEYVSFHDPSGHSDSMMKVATSANALLKEISDPMLEGFHFWKHDELSLRRRAMPIMCEFWGVLGEYSRQYLMHPAVRVHRRSTLMNGLGNWRDPEIGLPLMRSFRQPSIFPDGNVRCWDAFQLGRLLGLDRFMRRAIQADDNHDLRCLFEWNRIELMTAVDEVRLLADAAKNVNAPDKGFKFYSDPLHDDEDEHGRFIRWLLGDFFQDSMAHLPFFLVGYEGSYLFEQRDHGEWLSDVPESLLEQLQPNLHNAFMVVYSHYKQLEDEGGFWGDLEHQYEAIKNACQIPDGFQTSDVKSIPASTLVDAWDVLVEASNHLVYPVWHEHAPVAVGNCDWSWLKQGVAEMRGRGEPNPGVILLPNGYFVTGCTTPDMPGLVMQVDDPEEQVLFMDNSNGFGLLRVVSWSDLESGAAYNDDGQENEKYT